MAADQHPIILHQNECVDCDLQVAGFFMKKQLWIVSVVLTGSFLLAQNQSARAADSPAAAGAQSVAKGKGPDRAAAYYHFALAHMYEEQVATYGRSELANKAIEEYRAAGCTHIMLEIWGDDRTGQAKLFGDAVLPHFKK